MISLKSHLSQHIFMENYLKCPKRFCVILKHAQGISAIHSHVLFLTTLQIMIVLEKQFMFGSKVQNFKIIDLRTWAGVLAVWLTLDPEGRW